MRLPTLNYGDDTSPWPDLPYKGLNYYDLSDVLIFAGRENDIRKCGRLVQLPRTKLLFLHGSTGTGKSSFLRAGLIPFLEHRDRGYSFIREDEGERASHFIRSTDDPLCRLAEVLFLIGKTKRTRLTPAGLSTFDLSECMSQPQQDFSQFVQQSPHEIVQVLSCFSRGLPETLVLIVDQLEEVLTLRPGRDGDLNRRRFFQFLEMFMEAELDIKIVLSFRTEFFGRILDQLDYSFFDGGNIGYFLLKELSGQDLIRAIVRPTVDQAIEKYGSPREKYCFRFAPNVPQKIAADLKRTALAGGVLPVMQLVCGRLYSAAVRIRPSNEAFAEISMEDYLELGGVEGQLNGHLTDVLNDLCLLASVSPREAAVETRRWKRVLAKLVKVQIDGTVTTEVRPEAVFTEDAISAGCLVSPTITITHFSKDENRILRGVTVYNAKKRREIACLALGHDAIGLVLTGYPVENVGARISTNIRSVSGFAFFGLAILLAAFNAIYFLSVHFGRPIIGSTLLGAWNAIGLFYLGLSLAFVMMSTRFYSSVFDFAARSYSLLGGEAASKRLTIIAEDLRESSHAESEPTARKLLYVQRSRKPSNKRSRRPVVQRLRRPTLSPAIESLIVGRPWIGDVLVGLLMITSGVLKLLQSALPFSKMIGEKMQPFTDGIEGLAQSLKQVDSKVKGRLPKSLPSPKRRKG
jgi:hypothetical protein